MGKSRHWIAEGQSLSFGLQIWHPNIDRSVLVLADWNLHGPSRLMPEHLGHLNLTELETAILSDDSRGSPLVGGRVAHDAQADLYTEIKKVYTALGLCNILACKGLRALCTGIRFLLRVWLGVSSDVEPSRGSIRTGPIVALEMLQTSE